MHYITLHYITYKYIKTITHDKAFRLELGL